MITKPSGTEPRTTSDREPGRTTPEIAPQAEAGGFVPWTLEPDSLWATAAPAAPVQSAADLSRAIANASNVCEATFEALRIKAIQPGAPDTIEIRTALPASTLVSAERLAELYTARFGGRFEVIGLAVRPDGRNLTIAARIART